MAGTLELTNAAKLAFYDSKPVAMLTQTVVQSPASSAVVEVIFGSASYDDWGGWSSGTPNTYTVKANGLYAISGMVIYTSNATGVRDALIFYNGGNIVGSQVEVSGSASAESTCVVPRVLRRAVVGDTFQLATFQTSGGTLSTIVSGGMASSMTVEWIRA